MFPRQACPQSTRYGYKLVRGIPPFCRNKAARKGGFVMLLIFCYILIHMPTTTAPFGTDFAKEFVSRLLVTADEGTKFATRMLWAALMSFLTEHWLAVVTGLFIMLVIATLEAFRGYWGPLGSLIYNILYFGALLVIGLIWGPEIYVNVYFDVVYAILYPVCYRVTGLILRKMGVRRRLW